MKKRRNSFLRFLYTRNKGASALRDDKIKRKPGYRIVREGAGGAIQNFYQQYVDLGDIKRKAGNIFRPFFILTNVITVYII